MHYKRKNSKLRRRRHERILAYNDDKRNVVYRQLHKYSY